MAHAEALIHTLIPSRLIIVIAIFSGSPQASTKRHDFNIFCAFVTLK